MRRSCTRGAWRAIVALGIATIALLADARAQMPLATLLDEAEARNDPRLSEALFMVRALGEDEGYGAPFQIASAALFGAIGQYWLADRLLQAALDGDPAGSWAHYARFGLGLTSVARGDYQQSEAVFRAMAKAEPGSRNAAEALLALGWQETLLGRHDEAIGIFEQLSGGGYGTDVEEHARLSIAQNLVRTGRIEEAEVMLEDMRGDPGSPLADDALRELAWIAYERGDLGAAQDLFEELIATYDRGLYHGTTDELPDSRQMRRMSPRALARKLGAMALTQIRSLDRPLDVLLSLQNRSAAQEAAVALKKIERAREKRAAAQHGQASAARTSAPGNDPAAAASEERTRRPSSLSRHTPASAGLWVLLLLSALVAGWWILSGRPATSK